MPRSKAAQGTVANGITAIYNFGDSLSDTGNLLREGDASGVLQYTTGLPYGSTIGGATGRCSDGYLMIDFLAKDLGLPLLNPYLNKDADLKHGANFAVAGATALDAVALARRGVVVPHTSSSLGVQLEWFKEFMSANNTKSSQEIREKLAQSLVMVGEIGGNDYNYAFQANKPLAGGERNLYNFGRMVTGAARELLDMGATRLVIPGNFPLGCVPSYLSAANEKDPAAYDSNGCLIGLNLFAQMHNVLLQEQIRELRARRTRPPPSPTPTTFTRTCRCSGTPARPGSTRGA
ncbi:hypothetical protein PR202_gb08965 [Eleusine coracana subsp. coracana]|uniref:GDSL esterase/lipase n=1 Tax=Eleusine coracana subsp. coracana TaxID=191504 RepID=A0AAV5EFR3_ELECO|nr:hypothetical protein PR202_gb08965 [Eleusine coracana subsp. coracana]